MLGADLLRQRRFNCWRLPTAPANGRLGRCPQIQIPIAEPIFKPRTRIPRFPPPRLVRRLPADARPVSTPFA